MLKEEISKMKNLKIAFYAALIIAIILITGCGVNTDNKTPDATNVPMPTNRPRNDAPYYTNLIEGQVSDFRLHPEEYEEQMALGLNVSDSVCIQLYAVTDFNKLYVACPSYNNDIGTIKMSLYKWDINLDITLNGNALIEKLFVNFNDNEVLEFEFDPQEEGEYLLEITGVDELTGVWMTSAPVQDVRVYYNGKVQPGSPLGGISYINTPDKPLGPISDNIPYQLEYLKAPKEKELANDHPIHKLGVKPDTWAALDGLNRSLPSSNGNPYKVDKDRNVGIMYYLKPQEIGAVRTVAEIIQRFPNAATNPKHAVWGRGEPLYWSEPLFGFYTGDDTLVYRKHGELLANADVDFVVVNLNDGLNFSVLDVFLKSWSDAMEDGINVPKVVFATDYNDHGRGVVQLKQLFREIYKPQKYQELWFYYEDKPLIISNYDALQEEYRNEQEIKQYFTMRKVDTSYFNDTTPEGNWGIQSVYPQTRHSISKEGHVEQMVVSPAQNANYRGLTSMNGSGVYGRSYAKGEYSYSYYYNGYNVVVDKYAPNSSSYGLNFQQQWDYAIYVDPDFVLVNGWNDYIVKRYGHWMGIENAIVNQFTDEYSTDIEPSKGNLKDNYYYQLVANIRRYKGVSKVDYSDAYKRIDIKGDIYQWKGIPNYAHYINNMEGVRNNIINTKVAYDRNTIYFYVETRDDITPYTDTSWMRLYIDTGYFDNNWEGFEYIVNRIAPNEETCYLEISTGGFNWEVVGEIRYTLKGKVMQIEIPRHMLGIDSGWFSSVPSFNFKWADNVQKDGDIYEFYYSGDVAPIGRFSFRFNTN